MNVHGLGEELGGVGEIEAEPEGVVGFFGELELGAHGFSDFAISAVADDEEVARDALFAAFVARLEGDYAVSGRGNAG
jgi:hypothetical protein